MRLAWRRHLWRWLPPAVFAGAMLVALVVYLLVFAGDAAGGAERIEAETAQLQRLSAERRATERLVERIEGNREEISALYSERLSTESQRLTQVIREVQRISRDAGLVPTQVTYGEETFEEYGLTRFSFVFSVDGTYADLRKLINALELSEFFVTLEEVALAEAGGGAGRGSGSQGQGQRLRINLRLSTLFARPEAARSLSADGAGAEGDGGESGNGGRG